MSYSPELSKRGSATLRRLSWYMRKPMTKSLEMLIELTAMKMAEMRPGEVCNQCKDDRICDEWAHKFRPKVRNTINQTTCSDRARII